MVAGGRDVPVRRAEPGDDENIAAVAQQFVDDVATMQQGIRVGHLRASSLKFLAPNTRCPIRTAAGRHVLKAKFAAPQTVGATSSGVSARVTMTPMASS